MTSPFLTPAPIGQLFLQRAEYDASEDNRSGASLCIAVCQGVVFDTTIRWCQRKRCANCTPAWPNHLLDLQVLIPYTDLQSFKKME